MPKTLGFVDDPPAIGHRPGMAIPAGWPPLDTLAARVRWLRERTGHGAVDFALAAGLSHGSVSRLETGRSEEMDARSAFKLAAVAAGADDVAAVAQWLVCGHTPPLDLPR